ncbi:hypothetical protein GW17_00026006 [Ensete ventricosum]|nr:hypothetical protein GW17_00026006 [Ensete ventricosum]
MLAAASNTLIAFVVPCCRCYPLLQSLSPTTAFVVPYCRCYPLPQSMSLAIAFTVPCHRRCHTAAALFFRWTAPRRSPIAMQPLKKPPPPISLSGGGPLRSSDRAITSSTSTAICCLSRCLLL